MLLLYATTVSHQMRNDRPQNQIIVGLIPFQVKT